MNSAFLLTGSNLSAPEQQISAARQRISDGLGRIKNQSSVYRTEAWGNNDQPDFLNQVLQIETDKSARQLLQCLLAIEQSLGRVRTVKNAPRLIDIDILFFNNEIINRPELVVPHPHIPDRRFVLVPLHEIAPTYIHPVLHKTISTLLAECKDPLDVKRF